MDVLTLALSKGYTNKVVKELAGGLKYQGSKPMEADLPTPSESIKGHMYTVAENGHEYVCDGKQWIDLGADLTTLKEMIIAEAVTRSESDTELQGQINNKADKTELNAKADLPGECPPWLNPTGQTPYPWFMASLDVESTGLGPDAEGNLKANVGAYNFNNKQYYKWEKSLPFAVTTAKAGLMTSADKTKLDGVATGATATSVSATGTATDQVGYITINGVEKKLASGTNVEANVEITGAEDELISLKVGDKVYQNLNYHPFPTEFVTNKTLKEFGQSIVKYAGFATGCTWFGGINCTDLPCGMWQAECKVTAIRDKITWARNIAIVEVFSSEVAPFYWHYNTDSWEKGTSLDDWKFVASIDESKFDSSATYSDTYNVKVRKQTEWDGWEFYTEKDTQYLDGNNVGVIVPFAGTGVIPVGYLECKGQEVSRTTYQQLFSVIGTTYGPGDGSTTFNLPDLKEKFIEGESASVPVGTKLSAGLPNVEGKFSITCEEDESTSTYQNPVGLCANNYSGAFSGEHTNKAIRNISAVYDRRGESNYYNQVNFSATNSNEIYGNSDTVQPNAVAARYIIKYTNTLGTLTEVVANPTLVGTEADLTSLQVGSTKYKVSGGSGEPSAYIKDAAVANEKLTLTKKDSSTVELDVSGKADKTYVDTEVGKKLTTPPKVDDPEDPGYNWPYHFPYDAEVSATTDKVTLNLKTITLDNVFTKMNFQKELPCATTTTAGFMSADDKDKLNRLEELPAYPENKTKKYALGLKYENDAWVKYWYVTEDATSDVVDTGKVDYMTIKS